MNAQLKCSVWNNGRNGWGLKILGNASIRRSHFDKKRSPIIVESDGKDIQVNVNKDSFWNDSCGELISKSFWGFFEHHGLNTGDRVFLDVIEPYRRFRVVLT